MEQDLAVALLYVEQWLTSMRRGEFTAASAAAREGTRWANRNATPSFVGLFGWLEEVASRQAVGERLSIDGLCCSFCGVEQWAVEEIIRGSSVIICRVCILQAQREATVDAPAQPGTRCGFCDREDRNSWFYVRPQAAICHTCVATAANSPGEPRLQ